MMKKVVRCGGCSYCGYRYGFGFNGGVTLYCLDRGREVSREDGCTFGVKGEPQPYSNAPSVDVCGDHAAHGSW